MQGGHLIRIWFQIIPTRAWVTGILSHCHSLCHTVLRSQLCTCTCKMTKRCQLTEIRVKCSALNVCRGWQGVTQGVWRAKNHVRGMVIAEIGKRRFHLKKNLSADTSPRKNGLDQSWSSSLWWKKILKPFWKGENGRKFFKYPTLPALTIPGWNQTKAFVGCIACILRRGSNPHWTFLGCYKPSPEVPFIQLQGVLFILALCTWNITLIFERSRSPFGVSHSSVE